MPRSKRVLLQVEGMEEKALLSSFHLPTLTHRAFTNALRSIDDAAGRYARTGNSNLFLCDLSRISHRIPYGGQDLFPTWNDDLSIYDPGVRHSGVQMVNQIKADLVNYVRANVEAGTFRFC